MPVLLYTVWKLTDGDNTASDSYYCHYRGYCYFCRAVWHSMKLVSLLAVSFWFATGQCTSTDQSQAELPALYLDVAIVVMLMQYWAVRQFWNGYHSGIAVRLCWLKNKKKKQKQTNNFFSYTIITNRECQDISSFILTWSIHFNKIGGIHQTGSIIHLTLFMCAWSWQESCGRILLVTHRSLKSLCGIQLLTELDCICGVSRRAGCVKGNASMLSLQKLQQNNNDLSCCWTVTPLCGRVVLLMLCSHMNQLCWVWFRVANWWHFNFQCLWEHNNTFFLKILSFFAQLFVIKRPCFLAGDPRPKDNLN